MFKLKTIDNFLKLDDLNFLSKIKLDNIEKNNVKVYHNTIDKNGNINSSCIDENKIKTLQDKISEVNKNFSDLLDKMNNANKKS